MGENTKTFYKAIGENMIYLHIETQKIPENIIRQNGKERIEIEEFFQMIGEIVALDLCDPANKKSNDLAR